MVGAVAAVLVVLALVPAGAASAAPVTAPEVVLGGHLYPRPLGLTYVYGRLRVPDGAPASAVAGQTVTLYESVFPFTAWTPVATLTSDWEGYVSYHTRIAQNASFRAIWEGAAPVQSNDKLVKFPLRVKITASRPRRNLVTFNGKALDPHPGGRVYLQALDSHGGFRTVSATTIGAASTFRARIRVRRATVFRALFPGDGQFGAAASRPVRVR